MQPNGLLMGLSIKPTLPGQISEAHPFSQTVVHQRSHSSPATVQSSNETIQQPSHTDGSDGYTLAPPPTLLMRCQTPEASSTFQDDQPKRPAFLKHVSLWYSPTLKAKPTESDASSLSRTSPVKGFSHPAQAPSTNRTDATKREFARAKVADWFQGESNAMNISVLPNCEKEDMSSTEMPISSYTKRPSQKSVSQPIIPTLQKIPLTQRFSFFGSKSFAQNSAPQSLQSSGDVVDIDPKAAICPPNLTDLSPQAAFKDIVHNAEGLIKRLQAVCRERTSSLREMISEKETLQEELESTHTRVQSLRTQLDAMSAKLTEQDNVVMHLVESLAEEREQRRQEQDARQKSVSLIKDSRIKVANLEFEADHKSGLAESRNQSGLDTGSDSDDDIAPSVFSLVDGAETPMTSKSSFSTNSVPGTPENSEVSNSLAVRRASCSSPKALPRLPVDFQHTDNGFSTLSPQGGSRSPLGELNDSSPHTGQSGKASEAWDLVGILKEENYGLKERVCHLETQLKENQGLKRRTFEFEKAVDDCLKMVAQRSL